VVCVAADVGNSCAISSGAKSDGQTKSKYPFPIDKHANAIWDFHGDEDFDVVFRVMTPCCLVGCYHSFAPTCCPPTSSGQKANRSRMLHNNSDKRCLQASTADVAKCGGTTEHDSASSMQVWSLQATGNSTSWNELKQCRKILCQEASLHTHGCNNLCGIFASMNVKIYRTLWCQLFFLRIEIKSIHSTNQGTSHPVWATLRKKSPV
jgi:hypothetical protein